MLSPCILPMRLLQRPAAFTMLRAASQGVPGLHIALQPIGVRTFSKKVPTTPSNRPKLIGNNDHITPRNPDEVPSDVLYEYKRNSYFTMLSAGSLLQIAFWSWLKGTEASLPVVVPPPSAASAALDPSFLSIVTNEAWSSVGLGSSVIMALVVVFFSQRSIARISVISGGGKLRLTTHKFLGVRSLSVVRAVGLHLGFVYASGPSCCSIARHSCHGQVHFGQSRRRAWLLPHRRQWRVFQPR
ncbi:hypothetical protein AC1031_008983 [Aphanomyces cochlioides]|nr:hypothetical protein AC1031_008983 [Aphanomyces cochlioides]